MSSDVIFARPRHEYGSYADFWQLVELSGYPLIFIDEIDPQDADYTYIYSTPDASLEWPDAKARIIYWLIEWYEGYEKRDGISEVWSINADFAKQIGARFVPIGSHVGLRNPIHHAGNQFDVAHLSYTIPRRSTIYHQLQERGVKIMPNSWGEERNRNLSRTRAMIHIHQHDDIQAIAGLRVALAAAWKLPVITENGWSFEPLSGTHLFISDYNNIADATARWLKQDNWHRLHEAGLELFEYLCLDMNFRRWVEMSL